MAAAGLVVSGLIALPAASAGAAPCSDLTLIWVRGSRAIGESRQPLDDVGKIFNNSLKGAASAKGLTESLIAVDYDAARVVDLLVPGAVSGNRFLDSMADGLAKTDAALNSLTSSSCGTTTRVVLGGYSQGAMVIHQLLLKLSDAGDARLGRIASVGLVADGDQVAKAAAPNLGTAAKNATGIRAFGLQALPQFRRDTPVSVPTWRLCDAGDSICDYNNAVGGAKKPAVILARLAVGMNIHDAYRKGTKVQALAKSVASVLQSREKPKLVANPATGPAGTVFGITSATACPSPANHYKSTTVYRNQDGSSFTRSYEGDLNATGSLNASVIAIRPQPKPTDAIPSTLNGTPVIGPLDATTTIACQDVNDQTVQEYAPLKIHMTEGIPIQLDLTARTPTTSTFKVSTGGACTVDAAEVGFSFVASYVEGDIPNSYWKIGNVQGSPTLPRGASWSPDEVTLPYSGPGTAYDFAMSCHEREVDVENSAGFVFDEQYVRPRSD